MISEQPSGVSPTPPERSGRPLIERYVWWLVGIAVLLVSMGIVRWAKSRPGYDPYGWMIWGYQTIHGSLNLGGAPSWKPMPLPFTFVYAFFGHYQLWMWMTTAVALSLMGCVFAARIAFRIVDEHGTRRWPAIAAAVFAFLMPLFIYDSTHYSYVHYILSSQSDPPLVSFVLMAIDMHMMKKYRWAVGALTVASLGRPEAWPPEFLYALWLLRKDRTLLRFLIGNLVVLLFFWFGIPEITNHRPFLAGDLAQRSPRELHSNKVIGTIGRYKALNQWPVWLLAGIATAWAGFRLARKDSDPDGNHGLIVALFGMCVLWVLVEVVFALKGLPGVPRYMFEPGVTAIVIAAVGLGWLLQSIPSFFKAPWVLGLGVAAVLCALIVPGALSHARAEHKELQGEHARTTEIGRLAGLIKALGGRSALLKCGVPVINVEYASVTGWLLHRNTGQIGYKTQYELKQKSPTVFLTGLPNGWAAYGWHQASAACAKRTRILYLFTAHHPDGVVVPNRVPPKVVAGDK